MDLLRFQMFDPAVPAFVSATKDYIGTKEDMREWVRFIKNEFSHGEDNEASRIAYVMEDYWSGNEHAMNRELYADVPIFSKVKEEERFETTLKRPRWTHFNTWGFEYQMRCDQCAVESFMEEEVQGDETVYKVYSRFDFINMSMLMPDRDNNSWRKMNVGFWGNPGVLRVENKDPKSIIIYTQFWLETGEYKTKEEAEEAMKNPTTRQFATVMDEIFGDG